MKVLIPNEIKSGPYPYEVKLTPDLKLNEGTWGSTHFVKRVVRVDAGLPLLERNQTLIHELLHVISSTYQCALDEDNIERIANGLSEFLFDNLGIEFDWSGLGGLSD